MKPWRFEAIGTGWEIETVVPLSAADRAAVDDLVASFDRTWSRFRSDGLVSSLAAEPRTVPLPPDAPAMLGLYRELSDATGGAVQPLVGDALAHRGYDAGYSLRDRGPVPAPGAWQRILEGNEDGLTLREPATIDVGALGKGRLVDLVHGLLAERGHERIVVDAGGDLRANGEPIRVGLEHPYDPSRAIGVATVRDAALCASAVNRRAWGDGLHHVLDARTGEPVRTVAATWVLAPTAMLADAAATALFFDGGAGFAAAHGVEWVRMTTDGAVDWSVRTEGDAPPAVEVFV